MDRLLVETNVKHRFAERDLRAKVAVDAAPPAKARVLLQHAEARRTVRAYRRKPEWV
jgi:hypothetical protein